MYEQRSLGPGREEFVGHAEEKGKYEGGGVDSIAPEEAGEDGEECERKCERDATQPTEGSANGPARDCVEESEEESEEDSEDESDEDSEVSYEEEDEADKHGRGRTRGTKASGGTSHIGRGIHLTECGYALPPAEA